MSATHFVNVSRIRQIVLYLVLSILVFFQSITVGHATHIMGGELTYTQLANQKIGIGMRIYEDCTGALSFGAGSSANIDIISSDCSFNATTTIDFIQLNDITPICSTDSTACASPNGLIGVREYIFYGEYDFSGVAMSIPTCNFFLNWQSCCRNAAISTIVQTGGVHFRAHFQLVQDPQLPAPTNGVVNGVGPIFTERPVFYTCLNKFTNLNFGATSIDGDSLVYSLVDCGGISYLPGFSGTNPMTTNFFSFDSQTGILTVSPSIPQVAIICVRVDELRNGVVIGHSYRDIQVRVLSCSNDPPVASGINGTATAIGTTGDYEIEACVGQPFCFDFEIYDANSSMGIGAEYLGLDTTVSLTVDTSQFPAIGTICWTPTLQYGTQYPIPIRVHDDVCPIVGESFYTYLITIKPFQAGIDSTIYDPIIPNTSVTLSTTSIDPSCEFVWSPSATLSCDTCPNPIASPLLNTTYYASIHCGGLCETIVDSVRVLVISLSSNEISTINHITIAPNPSKNYTLLEYDLLEKSDVQIEVFDMVGRQLTTIVNQTQLQGKYQYNLQGKRQWDVGIYFIKLTIDGKIVTKKWVVQ